MTASCAPASRTGDCDNMLEALGGFGCAVRHTAVTIMTPKVSAKRLLVGDRAFVGLHINPGAVLPGQILTHGRRDHLLHVLLAIVVGAYGPANGVVQRVRTGFPELEAGAFPRLFIILLNGIIQPAGRSNNGQGAV